jgi:hypothetical protein
MMTGGNRQIAGKRDRFIDESSDFFSPVALQLIRKIAARDRREVC